MKRKLMALLVAVAMTVSMCVPAFADDSKASISVENAATGHTYEAYQLFAGDVHGGVLSNIVWGDGVTDEGKTALLSFGKAEGAAPYKSAAELANAISVDNVEAFAQAVGPYLKDPAGSADAPVDGKYVIGDLDGGYYLVKDKNGTLGNVNDAYTAFILKVAGDVSVEPKAAQPTVDKQVLDEKGDAEFGAVNGWGETADHAINESFQFKLIASIPADDDFAAYKTYKIVFNDTMSEGVTFESIASVKVNDVSVDAANYACTAKAGQAGGSWTLTINDILLYDNNLADGATIEVVYNAHLNENAVIGNFDDNLNQVFLQYSNNPNASGEELGKTVEDTVWVFTYLMGNTKVDGDGKVLEGAGFTLFADKACTQAIALIYDDDLEAYRPVAAGEEGVEMMLSDADGSFNIAGLDAGTYYLRETLTPAGYNTCADITVVIGAQHAENADSVSANTVIAMTVDGKEADAVEVVNQKGTQLPSTGGMGTMLFYAVGGLLVVLAAVLLVTRRRTSSED